MKSLGLQGGGFTAISANVHRCLRSFRLFKETEDVKQKDGYHDTGSSKSSGKFQRKFRRRTYAKNVYSIDPSTAKDLDDALHVTDIGNGMYEIGVHIADVSYFVTPGNELDKAINTRNNSIFGSKIAANASKTATKICAH